MDFTIWPQDESDRAGYGQDRAGIEDLGAKPLSLSKQEKHWARLWRLSKPEMRVAARNAEYSKVAPMVTDKDDQLSESQDQREKLAFRFLALCIIVSLTFFGLVHGAVYFKDLTRAAIHKKSLKAIIVLL
jgi:hypothetical protein